MVRWQSICQPLANHWPTICQPLANHFPTFGQPLAKDWPAQDPPKIHSRSTQDPPKIHPRSTQDPPKIHPRSTEFFPNRCFRTDQDKHVAIHHKSITCLSTSITTFAETGSMMYLPSITRSTFAHPSHKIWLSLPSWLTGPTTYANLSQIYHTPI